MLSISVSLRSLLSFAFVFPTVYGFGIEAPIAVASAASFFGWAFNPVGPSPEAVESIARSPPIYLPEINGLLFPQQRLSGESNDGSEQNGNVQPTVVIYCGAKVRPESYAPLVQQIMTEMENSNLSTAEGDQQNGGVLVVQSPFNIYAFKPVTVHKVLETFPSIRYIAGHSIGGIWAMEYCQDLYEDKSFLPEEKGGNGLSFIYLGVHSSSLSLKQFKDIPFQNVGFVYATRDVTLIRAAQKNEETVDEHLARIESEELPPGAKLYKIEGGNHSQYGSYGSPGYAQGLAYQDLEASISSEKQRMLIANVFVEFMRTDKGESSTLKTIG